jgi:cytoskeletal protein CcmA (bactofilin family)
MAKFLSGRQRNLNLGITSVTESSTVLQTIGKVGIGTSTAENYSLYVVGNERVTNSLDVDRNLRVTGISTFENNVEIDRALYVSGITTVNGGPLFVGGGTSTGTINQNLQVQGGAYISTYVSIGYTNPFANLTVFDQSGPWVALVDPGQSSSAFEDNAGNLYIRSEAGSGTAGEIIFQTGTANYQLRPSQSGSNRMRIDTDGDVLINADTATGTLGSKLQVFGSSYIQEKLGLGNTNPTYKLEVIGDTVITGFTSIGKQTDITGNLYVAGISTLTGDLTLGGDVTIAGDLDVDGHTELDNVNVSGTLTAYNLDVTNDFDIYAPDSVFYGNVTIQGNVSIAGTSIVLDAETVRIEDKDLILGFTTTVTPNDNTANHAGIAVASTEGHYLVPLQVVGINSLPDTYKQLMWVKHNTMGAGTTDAWLSNQAVGIGSTLVPNNIRLAVGDVKIGDFSITARNIAGTAATITSGNFVTLDAKTSYIDVGFATHLSGTSLNYVGISTINNVRGETLTLSGVSTFSGNVDINSDIDVDGHTELDNVNISGITTFVGFIDANGDLDVDGHTELDNVNISGIVTAFDLDVDGHTELDNINVSGVSTFVGIGTFLNDLYVGGDLYIADDLVFDEFTARNATLTGNLQVAGVSTFNGNVDINADIDVDGHTELDNVNISGVATFGSYLDINSFVDISGPINIGGISTFTGIGTFQSDLYVGGDLYVADDLVFDEFTARNATLTGNINGNTLIISGLTTFTTGPVLVGTGTSTGTSGQAFQVESGAYFAGPVGIASTLPNYDLDVNGDINFNGDLYKDGILFVAGVGIGSTEVNPQSGVITQDARVGTGFTDINFVGTGLSITGYGSTVVIDLDSVGGARVSVSTEPPVGPRAGDLWWESDSGDLKVYYSDANSSQWVDTNGGENLAVIGEFPPASPLAGDLWWDSVYGQLKIYYDDGDSQQWVDANSASNLTYWTGTSSPIVGIVTTDNVGIGTTVPRERLQVDGYISIDNRVSYGTTVAETSSTSQVGIHSAVSVASYRSVDYTIQATQGSVYHTTKITALHDGSVAYYNEYASIYNSSAAATYDVDISGGNIRLLATPASSGITTYNIIFDAIKV